ncbi:hypothetical protein ACX80T_15665 [Arthrobacter sp. Sr33]|uniref:hypothetical protein n=1 Tax=Arthrobacter sp. TB 23 TaxID=494419 RepID=UPI0003674147|nr:hypothetical protein [Arthrobacter sp. TB 23]
MILPAAYWAPEATNEPIRIEMVDGGAEVWEILAAFGPTAIVLAALITFFVQRQSLKHQRDALEQKTKSDSEAEWWRRVQWAIDAALAEQDPKRQRIGLGMLNDAAMELDVGTAEQRILLIVTDIVLAGPPPKTRRRIGRRRRP